jgi:hypothetical protein
MKAIQLKRNIIDIPFQDDEGKTVLTLQFDRSDEHVKEFHELFSDLEGRVSKLEKNGNDWDESEKVIKEIADAMLGEGSYEKMYKLNPSVVIITQYLYMIALAIKEELESEDLKAVESKYLK